MPAIRNAARAVALAACCLPAALLAATPVSGIAPDLVIERVDATHVTALPQDRLAWATVENDLGEVATDLQLSHLTLVLRRSTQQQAAFEEFLKQQQDQNSPSFHHWLTPVEVGARFGASQHDVDVLVRWLQSQGLQVDGIANSRTRIDFSGSAANVGAAFTMRLHAYLVNGDRRIAPASVPQIPAALSAIVHSVRGLATINERPYHRQGKARVFGEAVTGINPDATFCSGNTCDHYNFPGDFAAIYDVFPVWQQNIIGSGQTIAIIGRARVYMPDIENFQVQSGFSINDPVIVVPPGGIDPGPALSSGGTSPADADQFEATVDVTRATSVAYGATINLVISASPSAGGDGIDVATQYVVDNNPLSAQIMSISFGDCEANRGSSGVTFWDSLFSQASAEGISVFVSSDDSGAAGCDKSFSTPPAGQSASPNYICSSSYATCVGGTEFADMANPTAYWNSSNASPGFASAFAYIPEGAWNEPLDGNGNPQVAASGGGVSMFVPTPLWQTGPGVPGTQGRYTPDVSFSASLHDGYFICFAATGGACVADNTGHFSFKTAGGTSAAAPSMAGIAALLNQKMGSAQGNLNPGLYALAATPGNGVFNDVTASSSGVVTCDVSVPSMCNNSTPGPTGQSGGLPGYLVGPGYDEVTGLGSIDVAHLLAHWSPSGPAGTTIAVEYYYSVWNFYFETAFPAEIAALDGGAFGGAWQRTGQTFFVWPQAVAGSVPTCRFFSTAFGGRSAHFYTPYAAECLDLQTDPALSSVWQLETPAAFYLALTDANGNCPTGLSPLYRVYNNGMGGAPNHRYTTDPTIRALMLTQGWLAEGNGPDVIFACVP